MTKHINGTNLEYEVAGPFGRPWVVFVHGFPFNGSIWLNEVATLARDFQVLTFDLRGHGQSGLGDAHPSIDTYVDDLFGLMSSLGISKAALVGHSLGGYIALRAMERSAERFWALVLCDTTSAADSDETRAARDDAMTAIEERGVEAFVSGLLPKLLIRTDGDAADSLLQMMRRSSAEGMVFALTAIRDRTDTTASLGLFDLPTLVMVGSQDVITPPSDAEDLVSNLLDARLQVLRGAGHVSNLEAGGRFLRALQSFLDCAAPQPLMRLALRM
jgi:pimeloyl-ACP methyl ester carboxylesterase